MKSNSTIILASAILTIALLIWGGCDSAGAGTESKEVAPIDSPAYKLGREHGQDMLTECRSTDEIRDRMLDLRAREHIIRTQVSPTSADAYIQGIEDYILESGDTLATTLNLH